MTAIESSDIPIYIRLRGIIAAMIIDGSYPEGAQLPSVRAFATRHGVNPLTIAKAYQSLQDEGFVEVRRGIGMFVAEAATERLRIRERTIFIEKAWPRLRAHIERLGIGLDELLATH